MATNLLSGSTAVAKSTPTPVYGPVNPSVTKPVTQTLASPAVSAANKITAATSSPKAVVSSATLAPSVAKTNQTIAELSKPLTAASTVDTSSGLPSGSQAGAYRYDSSSGSWVPNTTTGGTVKQALDTSSQVPSSPQVTSAQTASTGKTINNQVSRIVDPNTGEWVDTNTAKGQLLLANQENPSAENTANLQNLNLQEQQARDLATAQAARTNSQYNQLSQDLKTSQAKEKGVANLTMARMGGIGQAVSSQSYMQDMASKHQQAMDRLDGLKAAALEEAQTAMNQGLAKVAEARINDARNIIAQAEQEKTNQLEKMSKLQDVYGKTFQQLAQSGLTSDDLPSDYFDALDKEYAANGMPVYQGFAKSLFDVEAGEVKVKQATAQAELETKTYEQASKLVDILNKVPSGKTINIGGNEYTGLSMGDQKTGIETDANGNSTFWSYDSSTGRVQTTPLGQIGKAVDGWETKFDDSGNAWRLNASTGQMVPFQPSETQKIIEIASLPEGSTWMRNGQPATECGQFVNDLTGAGLGDSFQSKIAKTDPSIKPNSENPPQVGDFFVQKLNTWTGHCGIVIGSDVGPDGKTYIRCLESNYPKKGKITNSRVVPASQISGFGRTDDVSPLLKVGPDSKGNIVKENIVQNKILPTPQPVFKSTTTGTKTISLNDLEKMGLDPTDPSNIGLTEEEAKTKMLQKKISEESTGLKTITPKTYEEFTSGGGTGLLEGATAGGKNTREAYNKYVQSVEADNKALELKNKIDNLSPLARSIWKEPSFFSGLAATDQAKVLADLDSKGLPVQNIKESKEERLPSAVLENMDKGMQAFKDVQAIYELTKKISNRMGPVKGRVTAMNPYDNDVVALNSKIRQTVPGLARGIFGETGVLTNQDIENYTKTLASPTVTPEQAKLLTESILTKINSALTGRADFYKSAGYSRKQIDSLISSIQAKTGEGKTGKILVKDRQGRIGYVASEKFDSSKYIKI